MPIKMYQPSLILNSFAFENCGLEMDFRWDCPITSRPDDIVRWILGAYYRTPNRHLHNVILNFHGKPGEIYIGESAPEIFVPGKYWKPEVPITIDYNNADCFTPLKGKYINTIWLHSCNVAAGWKGNSFCQKMAVSAGCNVVAAESTQDEWWAVINKLFMPWGSIDDYEGQVYIWDSKGHRRPFAPNGGYWK